MSADDQQSQTGNKLLNALPSGDRARLLPHLRRIELPFGKVIHAPGSARRRVYFPVNCVVSKMYVTEAGDFAEVAIVGNEGLIGIPLLFGCTNTPVLSLVQVAGSAWYGDGSAVRREFEQSGGLRSLTLHFIQAVSTQMGQNAVCYRHHRVEQQLCCWLLLLLDRVHSDPLRVTQQLIAQTLGIRREGVNAAVGHLQRSGILRHTRGCIEVLDRSHLESACCECYFVMKREYERLLPWTRATTASARAQAKATSSPARFRLPA